VQDLPVELHTTDSQSSSLKLTFQGFRSLLSEHFHHYGKENNYKLAVRLHVKFGHIKSFSF